MPDANHTFAVLAYGDSPYLNECLESLARQVRLGVVTICTSTPSKSIEQAAKRFDAALLINPQRSSMADDWTFAYHSAKTPYVTLAHQDDRYLPNYAEEVLAAVEKRPDALIAFCDYAEIIGDRVHAQRLNLWIKHFLLWWAFRLSTSVASTAAKQRVCAWGCPICCPSVTFHKRRIGDFAFDPSYRFVTDWEAWLRLARREGSFIHLNRRLMHHRLHAESETTRLTAGPERGVEEQEMLARCWPKPVASAIAAIYRLGHRSNQIDQVKCRMSNSEF